jgi:arginine repressor
MVRQSKTEAESCWDDESSVETDEKCEKYLQSKQKPARADATPEEEDEDEVDEDIDEEEDDDAVDEDDEEVDEEDEDDEDADADDAEALGTDPEIDSADTTPTEASITEATNPRGEKMAKKSVTGAKTKAEHIREVIAAKKAAGAELRPRDIIAALEKRGVEVNASQVSITMRAMGIPAMRKGGGAKPKTAKTVTHEAPAETKRATLKLKAPVSEPSVNGAMHAIDEQIGAAADFIHAVGGYERAVSLLNLCNKVSSRV